jgi:alcohol dehydrogenase
MNSKEQSTSRYSHISSSTKEKVKELLEFQSRTQVVSGAGAFDRLGPLAKELGFKRVLLVADRGLFEVGHFQAAAKLLSQSGVGVVAFHDFGLNPTTADVEAGLQIAAAEQIDSIIGLGGGSSMDCAKGINLVVTNGGVVRDYWGYGKAAKALLPMIGIPTTAGTGSEAQSYALISDEETRAKMACGDPKAAFKLAILDPRLLVTQPQAVRAAAGFDAISHAVEASVTLRRNVFSDCFAREAWRLLQANYERVLAAPDDLEAGGTMQLGAHLAGAAIENSMLGAAHACANPLTARYGTIHGLAIALLLPAVVRWNGPVVGALYADLLGGSGHQGDADDPAEKLAQRLEELAAVGGLATRLSAAEIPRDDLPMLAEDAAEQWTGRFNPRPFGREAALEVYKCAY